MSDGIASDVLESAREHGAHEDCLTFIRENPESEAASHLMSEHEYDHVNRAGRTGGYFFQQLWEQGAKAAYGTASENNVDRLEATFGVRMFRNVNNPHRPPTPR